MSGLPFNPLREELYLADELYDQFDPARPSSYARCTDIKILSYFTCMGKNPTRDSRASTLEALHDNSIAEAVLRLTAQSKNVIAVMGGHEMLRGHANYTGIARIAHELARNGFLMVSGGGPGAMEATHLGAFFSKRPVAELDLAIKELKAAPPLPKKAKDLANKNGGINPAIASKLHAWLLPAFKIRNSLPPSDRGISLGIPTWLYGYEPTTPLATHSGKYFQNSIREDGLVSLGVNGIIYSEGSAGTVQEIFQDAAKAFYDTFYPMVFLSSPAAEGKHFWEKEIPVRPLVKALLGKKPGYKNVLFTDSAEKCVSFLSKLKSGVS